MAPQVRPAPNEVNNTRSPWRIRPERHAWSSAIGIEAADVLPTSATSTMAFAGSIPSRSTTDDMIRAFAWWGISTSMSSIVRLDFSRSSRQAEAISVTARLKTSRPLGMRTV